MKQEDIIRMARACGINFHQAGWPELERFAAFVAAAATEAANVRATRENAYVLAEREACAKVCEPQEEHDDPLTAWKIAKAIRARGQA